MRQRLHLIGADAAAGELAADIEAGLTEPRPLRWRVRLRPQPDAVFAGLGIEALHRFARALRQGFRFLLAFGDRHVASPRRPSIVRRAGWAKPYPLKSLDREGFSRAGNDAMMLPTVSEGDAGDEVPLVPSDALSGAAGELQDGLPLGLGRRALEPVRSESGPPRLQRISRRARIRRGRRFRRHLRQRASPERLRADALAQSHRR